LVRRLHAGRRGDAAIHRHSHFHQDQRTLVLTPPGKAFVETARLGLADAQGHFNPRRTHAIGTMSSDSGIGVDGCGYYAAQARSDESFSAWAGASGVVARLQVDVGGAAEQAIPCVLRGHFEGDHFGVIHQRVLMPALAGHLPRAIQNHAAHSGVG